MGGVLRVLGGARNRGPCRSGVSRSDRNFLRQIHTITLGGPELGAVQLLRPIGTYGDSRSIYYYSEGPKHFDAGPQTPEIWTLISPSAWPLPSLNLSFGTERL